MDDATVLCADCGLEVRGPDHECPPIAKRRPLPSQIGKLPDWINTISHPRRDEYAAYCRRRRFPLSFWDWLSHGEVIPKRTELQALMDQPYCVSPLRLRRIKRRGK